MVTNRIVDRDYRIEFVKSQIAYYTTNMLTVNVTDRGLCVALKHRYEQELRVLLKEQQDDNYQPTHHINQNKN